MTGRIEGRRPSPVRASGAPACGYQRLRVHPQVPTRAGPSPTLELRFLVSCVHVGVLPE